MRLCIAIALVSFSAGIFALTVPMAPAQEQPASSRRVVTKVIPSYPDLARRMYLRGTVKVEAVVAPNGAVKSTRVIGGSPLLTRSAVDAIGKWKWAPAPQESKEVIELSFHPE